MCSRCGHVWHVNHHKRRYTQQELTALLPESWKPVCVNYTGDITTLRTGVHETEFADFFGFDIHSVEGMVCPKCGGKSILRGTDELDLLHRMAGFDAEFPFPTYSEIGILFCRADEEAQLRIHGIRGKNRSSGCATRCVPWSAGRPCMYIRRRSCCPSCIPQAAR